MSSDAKFSWPAICRVAGFHESKLSAPDISPARWAGLGVKISPEVLIACGMHPSEEDQTGWSLCILRFEIYST